MQVVGSYFAIIFYYSSLDTSLIKHLFGVIFLVFSFICFYLGSYHGHVDMDSMVEKAVEFSVYAALGLYSLIIT